VKSKRHPIYCHLSHQDRTTTSRRCNRRERGNANSHPLPDGSERRRRWNGKEPPRHSRVFPFSRSLLRAAFAASRVSRNETASLSFFLSLSLSLSRSRSRCSRAASKFALVTNCARLRRPGERSIIRTNRDNLTMDKCRAGCSCRPSGAARRRAISAIRVLARPRHFLPRLTSYVSNSYRTCAVIGMTGRLSGDYAILAVFLAWRK